MSNPWEEISLSDYENHMSLESVYQLQILNEMMGEQFASYDAKSIMILGIAGGNGLEHVDKNKFKKVYGVDVNPNYLAECKKRYRDLDDILDMICVDLLDADLRLPHTGFLVANLLVEYIGYESFQRVVETVKPQHVSCIIQINTGSTFVSDSPYIHAFDGLWTVHHQMDETNLVNCMKDISYRAKTISERLLPNGKKLVRIDFTIMEEEKDVKIAPL